MMSANSAAPGPEALLSHVQSVWDRIRPNSSIYNFLLSEIRLVSASPGVVVAHLALAPVHLNSKRTLHGAVSAAIVDWAGGMAIASTGLAQTGVSTDIHVSYVSAAREGDVLEITGRASRVGRSVGFTTVEIAAIPGGRMDAERRLVCTASHTKFLGSKEPKRDDASEAQPPK
jgi:acyl-coenzyme A thioesterase 13